MCNLNKEPRVLRVTKNTALCAEQLAEMLEHGPNKHEVPDSLSKMIELLRNFSRSLERSQCRSVVTAVDEAMRDTFGSLE